MKDKHAEINANIALFAEIISDEHTVTAVHRYIESHKVRVRVARSQILHGKWFLVMCRRPMLRLAAIVMCLDGLRKRYIQRGIPMEVYNDTMQDLRVWVNDHRDRTGEVGLWELNWLQWHVNMQIFKVGRLQYQLSHYHGKSYAANGITVHGGERSISLHIPRGGRLDTQDCRESLVAGQGFLKEFFPEYAKGFYTCHSWLLYSGNAGYMKADSNILRFAAMFDVIEESESPSQPMLWIYGLKVSNAELMSHKRETGTYIDTDRLPATNSLQRAATEYIRGGGILGEGNGILVLSTI